MFIAAEDLAVAATRTQPEPTKDAYRPFLMQLLLVFEVFQELNH